MQIWKAEILLCCLIITLDFFVEFISLQISITIRYCLSHWNEWSTPLWETPLRFTGVAKPPQNYILNQFFSIFSFFFFFFPLLDAGLKAYFCTWITLEPDSSLKAHQMLMPWGTWQHTSASFKILSTPFLKAIFIILRLCPCIEAISVLTSLWEAVRLSRTFCLWASIRFLWSFFLLFFFFFLLHSSRFLTVFLRTIF